MRKAQRIAMLSSQPVFILREVFQYFTNQRIVAPGYTYLQDMVGRIVSGYRLLKDSPLGSFAADAAVASISADL